MPIFNEAEFLAAIKAIVREAVREEIAAQIKPAKVAARFLTAKQAAQHAGFSVKHIQRAIHTGKLVAHNRGHGKRAVIRIRIDDLDAWMTSSAVPAPSEDMFALAQRLRAKMER